ncbi:uncharacterized protein LOC143358764 [Halictus rubicundus]|uniref:uncharacterized protein LOC143358764 n=1 Tax=Halictus rubicundus TaxID=77578 RepID=UPI004035E352
MIGGITRRIVLVCLVNAILVAGSSRIYEKDLSRSRRDASCPSCSRDRPDALANWSSPPREPRDAANTFWSSSSAESSDPLLSSPLQSSPLQPSSLQFPRLQPPFLQPPQYGSPFPLGPANPFRGTLGGRGGHGPVIGPWSTSRRENPFSFGLGGLNPDLASAPTSPLRGLNPPISPIIPFRPSSSIIGNFGRVPYRRPNLYGLSRSEPTLLNQGKLDYDPILGSVYEDPKTKMSVVYRADKLNDDSSEEDNVPLYPSDYPRRLVNGVQANVYSSDYPRSWRVQGLVNGVPQDNAPFPVDYLRRADGGVQDVPGRKLAAVQLSRAEAIVKPLRELKVLNGAGNVVSQLRDTRMADRATEPQEHLDDTMVGAVLRHPQTDQIQDARMADRIIQGDQSRESRVTNRASQPQKHQTRDSRMADRFMQPQIDETQDARMLQSFAQSQKDQPRESRMVGSFAQPQDQSRDARMADQFSQPPEDDDRMSSIMQVPETGARHQNTPSELEILKMIQQIGTMFANRSSLEDQRKDQGRDQQGVQLAKKSNENDQAHRSNDFPGTGEVKEKRDVANGEKVPVMANDQLELSSFEDLHHETTPKTVTPVEFIETMS